MSLNVTNEAIAALYDFPGIFEPALKALFTALEIKAFTTQAVPSTGSAESDQELIDEGFEIIDFQLDRPRVEILFTPGAGQGRFRSLQISATREVSVETSWSGQFKLDVITAPDIRQHRAFVTAVRYVMHTQLYTVNGIALTQHVIHVDFKDAGTTPALKSDQGDFQTSMLFDIDFSIQDDAWPVFVPDVVPAPTGPRDIDDTAGNPFADTGGNVIGGF